MDYVELWVTSNFSFLKGGSHPEELIDQAAAQGQQALALTDHNTMAGIVRAHSAAKKSGIRLIPACRLSLVDGPDLLCYPTDRHAYGRICALLTLGNRRTEKGKCELFKRDVFRFSEGCIFLVIPPAVLNDDFDFEPSFYQHAASYKAAFGNRTYLAACRHYDTDDAKILFLLSRMARDMDIPMVATNNVLYHDPARRELQDVLTCIREKCTVTTAGYKLQANAERHMKSPEEMARLFRQYPDAIARTKQIADACQFSLDSLEYLYPKEILVPGRTPQEQLAILVDEGLNERFAGNVPEKVSRIIAHEMKIIAELQYAEYFLTVYDICRYARDHQILYQGRGSAANSAVCYYLGITNVDPDKFELLFERFISSARNEKPDIDVDFEHERREEVMQYIYRKYGRDRSAIIATVTQVHQKTAIRDVGKAMGLSQDALDRLSGSIYELTPEWFDNNKLSSEGFDPNSPHLQKILALTAQYIGFPRQLGQHTGGFVITETKITDLCPVFNARMENRTNIEWNKDDVEALGFLKIDVLALGMLTAIRKAFQLAKQHYGLDLTLYNIPPDDPAVYDMISAADTIGVFQIESRAQQSMLPRLKPRCFFDLVIEVAIVRPGPIQGDMVHPYLRRRSGEEPIEYPSKELEDILKRTLGVPLFQEQAMKIVMVAAGFSAAEADELRRGMATFKLTGIVSKFRDKVVAGMLKNGYTKDYALRLFKQLEGFGSYGFPESHAASFAHLVYVSSWIKCHYPDIFAAAILNSLPMGFYQPAQLVIDARKHGVPFLPVDVNYSMWDYTLERKEGKYYAVRMGLRQVNGLRQDEALLIIAHRRSRYTSVRSVQDSGIAIATLEKLANAGAFASLHPDRRKALWEVAGLSDEGTIRTRGKEKTTVTRQLGLFETIPEEEDKVRLPQLSKGEQVLQDYASTALTLAAHPVSFIREELTRMHCLSAKELASKTNGDYVYFAGLVLVKQRPGTAKGVCFITLEDETDNANLIVWPSLFDMYKREILHSRLLMVGGHLQVEKGIRHIIVQFCYNMDRLLTTLATPDPFGQDAKEVRQHAEAFPGSRDFK